MGVSYTLEEVKHKLKLKGFTLIDGYIRCNKKVMLLCHCGKTFEGTPSSIFQNNTKSCGHCNEPKIGDRFNSLTIINIKPSRFTGCQVKCICDCGRRTGWHKFNKIIGTKAKEGMKTCCHCTDPSVGDRSGSLVIIDVVPDKYKGCRVKCKCDCGNITEYQRSSNFTRTDNKNTTSCGHCNDPKIGDKFHGLTVVKVKITGTNGCSIKCQCDCGKFTKYYEACHITKGSVRSCGNCNLLRNGVKTSHTALELQKMVEHILQYKCEHNKIIDDKSFDIICEELKIAIEYDSYYWHRYRHQGRQRELKTDRIAIKNGYKLLRIRAEGHDLPTEKQLKKVLLNHFSSKYRKWTITLSSWKKAQDKHKEKYSCV